MSCCIYIPFSASPKNLRYIIIVLYLPDIKYVGAQTSNNIVASLFRTQWYTKSSAFAQLWSCPRSLQLFLLAADTHSVALEGHRFTMETVGIDSGHIFNAKDCNELNHYHVIEKMHVSVRAFKGNVSNSTKKLYLQKL